MSCTPFSESLAVFRALSDTTPMTAAELDKASVRNGRHNMLCRLKKWARTGIVREAGRVITPSGQIARQYVRSMSEDQFIVRFHEVRRTRLGDFKRKDDPPVGEPIRTFTLAEMVRAQIRRPA